MSQISKYDDVIDSHDIIYRYEELRGEKENLQDAIDSAAEEFGEDSQELLDAEGDMEDWARENQPEMDILDDLIYQGQKTTSGWNYGVTLVRDSYFVEYAKEFAGYDEVKSWPYNHIDWESAADELRNDFTDIEFDGVTYWVGN
jgi:hypothetical protein